jgi:hypothetical protein
MALTTARQQRAPRGSKLFPASGEAGGNHWQFVWLATISNLIIKERGVPPIIGEEYSLQGKINHFFRKIFVRKK